MSKFTFELTHEEGTFRINVLKGNVPHHTGMPLSDPEMMSEWDGCSTPGEALRVFADACDRAMAAAWFEGAAEQADSLHSLACRLGLDPYFNYTEEDIYQHVCALEEEARERARG